MASQQHDIISVTTPYGHEVTAELDYAQFEIRDARVAHRHTGVMKRLDPATSETLARALKAKRVYEHALEETRAVEQTLTQFRGVSAALGEDHPALAPYAREARQHRTIAEQMGQQARVFYTQAMQACDDIAGD